MALTVTDAGVLIAVLDAGDVHHQAASDAVRAARARGDRIVVPASAYAEAMVRPSATGPAAQDRLDRFLDDLAVTVEPATRAIGRRAAELRAVHGKRLRLPDTLVLATAAALDASRVLTTDAGWPETGVAVEVIGSARQEDAATNGP